MIVQTEADTLGMSAKPSVRSTFSPSCLQRHVTGAQSIHTAPPLAALAWTELGKGNLFSGNLGLELRKTGMCRVAGAVTGTHGGWGPRVAPATWLGDRWRELTAGEEERSHQTKTEAIERDGKRVLVASQKRSGS